jgi:hypothetical protein
MKTIKEFLKPSWTKIFATLMLSLPVCYFAFLLIYNLLQYHENLSNENYVNDLRIIIFILLGVFLLSYYTVCSTRNLFKPTLVKISLTVLITLLIMVAFTPFITIDEKPYWIYEPGRYNFPQYLIYILTSHPTASRITLNLDMVTMFIGVILPGAILWFYIPSCLLLSFPRQMKKSQKIIKVLLYGFLFLLILIISIYLYTYILTAFGFSSYPTHKSIPTFLPSIP